MTGSYDPAGACMHFELRLPTNHIGLLTATHLISRLSVAFVTKDITLLDGAHQKSS